MGFPDEVAEQGKVLRDLVEFYRRDGDELLTHACRLASRRPRSITFVGMGTSEFVPTVIRDYVGEMCPVPVLIWEAGELLHYGIESIRDDDVVIAVSQSGESIETRRVVQILRDHRRLMTVTNNSQSTMARLSRLDLPMLAGEEASISNKTYTNSIGVMLLLSRALAGRDWTPVLADLEGIADEMDGFLATRRDEAEAAGDFLRDGGTVYFISRGPAFAAARQAALTFQEGCHIFTCALPGASMRHGPFEIVGPGYCAVTLAPEGHGGDLVRNMALEMAELGSKVVLMTAAEVEGHVNLRSVILKPGDPEIFSLSCAVPQELMLHQMAADRGWTAGVFHRGGKITERE